MASITCGKCKATHTSVAAVKACYMLSQPLAHEEDHRSGMAEDAAPKPANCPRHGGPADDPSMLNGCWECDMEAAEAKADRLDGAPKAAPVILANSASAKQVDFIVKLWGERYPDTTPEALVCVRTAAGMITKQEASQQITTLLALPKVMTRIAGANDDSATAQAASENPYVKAAAKGDVHVVDGTYYRIHISQTTGYAYAAKATIYGEATWAEDGKLLQAATIRWDRCKGMIYKLGEATKATPEEAARFGKLVGRCCFCSKPIDTPESTAAGYGPKCASNYGLPWGEAITAVSA